MLQNVPAPSWLSALAGVALTELEIEFPGLLERMRERLAERATPASVIRLRGAESEREVREAAATALAWLLMFDGLFVRPSQVAKRKKRRA